MIEDIVIIVLFVFFNWLLFKKDKHKVFNIWLEVFYRGLIPCVLCVLVIYFLNSYLILLLLPITLILEYLFFSSELVLDRELGNSLGVKLLILNFDSVEPCYNTVKLYIDTSEQGFKVKDVLMRNINKMKEKISPIHLNEIDEELNSIIILKNELQLSDEKQIEEINTRLEELNNPINQIPSRLKEIKKQIKVLEKAKTLIVLGEERKEKELEYQEKILTLEKRKTEELERLKENETYKESIKEIEEYMKLVGTFNDFYMINFYVCWNDFVKDDFEKFLKVILLRREYTELELILKQLFDKSDSNVLSKVLNLNCAKLFEESFKGRRIASIVGIEGQRDERLLKELTRLSFALEKIKIIHKDYEFEVLQSENDILRNEIEDIKVKYKKLKDYKEDLRSDLK